MFKRLSIIAVLAMFFLLIPGCSPEKPVEEETGMRKEEGVEEKSTVNDVERELEEKIDSSLEDLLATDNLEGYLLPVISEIDKNEALVKLIDREGKTVIKENKMRVFEERLTGFLSIYRGRIIPQWVDRTNPLVLDLAGKNGRKHVAISHQGELLPNLVDYNNYGYIDYEDDNYGFVDYFGNRVLDLEYDFISILGERKEYLIVIKNDKRGLVDSASGEIIIEPRYDLSYRPWIDYALFKVEIDGEFYLLDERGEKITEFGYSYIKPPSGELFAVRVNGKWGVINPQGDQIVDPELDYNNINIISDELFSVAKNGKWGVIDHEGNQVVDHLYNFVSGQSFLDGNVFYARQNGRWGLLDSQGDVIIEPAYLTLSIAEWDFLPEDVFLFRDNATIGFLDSAGEILFKEHRENLDLSKIRFPRYPISQVEGMGNYIFFVENDKIGIKNIDGEVVEEPAFEDYSFTRAPATCGVDPFLISNMAKEYIALKKDGLWAFFNSNGFVTDFKFDSVSDPLKYSQGIQALVQEEGAAGLYDIKSDSYIISPLEYEAVDFIREDRAKVKKDGKYGFADQYGQELIKPQYEQVSTFEHGVAAVIKDNRLNFIDSQGNYLLEPVKVDPPSRLTLEYLSGPGVYTSVNYSYFNKEGWIRKP